MSTPALYLNTPACGLVSKEVIDSSRKINQMLPRNSSRVAEIWRQEMSPLVRKSVADFLSAAVGEVAFIPNFSYGLNAVLQSLHGTERVLLYRHDYPSLIDPFLLRDFRLFWVDDLDGFSIDLAEIEESFKRDRIEVLAISHVQWLSGFCIDLDRVVALCKQYGVVLILDATQSLGAVDISLSKTPVDVLIASNYKWMNAGFGTGVLLMKKSFFDSYAPRVRGFNSYLLEQGEMVHHPSVRDYEPGHPNMVGFWMLEAALREKERLGFQTILEGNRQMGALFLTGIAGLDLALVGPHDLSNRASIYVLRDEDGLSRWLQDADVVFTTRQRTVRLGFHYQNTLSEVERLLDLLLQFDRQRA